VITAATGAPGNDPVAAEFVSIDPESLHISNYRSFDAPSIWMGFSMKQLHPAG
jgi:hypothetical protein